MGSKADAAEMVVSIVKDARAWGEALDGVDDAVIRDLLSKVREKIVRPLADEVVKALYDHGIVDAWCGCAKHTFTRLQEDGFSREEAMDLLLEKVASDRTERRRALSATGGKA